MSTLPNGFTNGPSRSEAFSKDVQVWERPWSLEEIRQQSANWSLAADSGLFLFLQDFSQRMLSKTHEIEKQLDSLIRDTKATDSHLHSVFNDFLMLSNTQFIENRVYDEEVEETMPKADASEKQPEQEKTREQKEAELIPKMQEAVSYGLKVLESAFEHLDIKAGNSDSEDEEILDRVEAILEPKDLYVDRPLPYLIGSQAFMEQDDVGLGDLSSDELSVDSDRDSVVDSENDKEEFNSDDDVSQEEPEAPNNIQKKSSMVSFEEEEDEDSDLFEKSEEDDAPKQNTGEFRFEDELAARIKGEQMTRPEGDRASLASKKKSKDRKEPKPAKLQAAEEDSDDMFKPPKMDDYYDDDDDDDFSPFGGKSGLFSGGKGLFDDDDEGDLFPEVPKPALEEKRVMNEKIKSTSQTAESRKVDKKIPAGAVSIFPDNSLFGSGQSSDSEERKENRTPAVGTKTAPTQTLIGAGGGGGVRGLFDDDEDDDFFSGKTLKKSDSAVQEKAKLKNSIDLFDDEDDDGDLFSGKFKAATPTQSKKESEEEKDKPPEKKMPAGAISMFGPATKSLLSEGLKKRQMSTSEDSEKNEEVVPTAADVGKTSVKPIETSHSTSLFSDDEEPQLFPGVTKSQSKPDPSSLGKTSKTPLSLFDDEEEEDIFASAAKSQVKPSQVKPSQVKPSQAKVSVPPPTKPASSSLFSDDEDQWIGPKSSSSKAESKTGGMKTSTSAPSNLPSTKIPQKSSLFDDKDDDDLFADTKTSSQKKPQRVALLFEDEGDDEGKESLFGKNPAVHTNSEAPTKMPVATLQSSSKPEQVLVSETPAKDKPTVQPKPSENKPEALRSPESTEIRTKPAGAVSLFGGIDVLSSKQTKGPLDDEDQDDLFLSKGTPPPMVRTDEKKEDKGKTKTVSLFDEEDEDESEWNVPIFSASKPTAGKTQEPAEEQQQKKSTGVFQDEELLFSQTQQKDNDPDVDLFEATTKVESSKVSPMKPVAQNLFSDDDEDDIFSSVKATPPPPTVAKKSSKPLDKAPLASPDPVSEIQKPAPSPVKPKDSSSRIGKLQASLMINPAALLPGALSSMSGTLSSSSGVSSSSLSPSPVSTPIGGHEESEGGVSFDTPVQVTTLQSAHKGRAKGSALRRPQSRAARQLAVKKSIGDTDQSRGDDVFEPNPSVSSLALPPSDKSNPMPINPTSPETSTSPKPLPSQPSTSQSSSRPNELSLPVSTKAGTKDSSEDSSSTKKQLPLEDDDLFGSDSLFGTKTIFNKPSPRETPKSIKPQASSEAGLKKDVDPSQHSSIFDTHTDDLFQNVKPRSVTKKAKVSPFMDDDDDDLFGLNSSATTTSKTNKEIKNGSSFSTHDIFQDEATIVPKVDKKLKDKSIDAALFDDNVDIFADLTDTFKPKPKSKLKGETKSIFDDDMDDIFTTSTAKPVPKAPDKSKKTPPAKETSTAPDSSDIFDDPLNILGGN